MTTQILGYIADPTAEERAKRAHRQHMEKAIYFLKQRMLGIIALLVGITALFATSEGAIASALLIPYGIAMIVSKEKMITEETEDNENEQAYNKGNA